MSYRPEPKFAHDGVRRVGVLLVNLGTPDAATPAAVRRYLAEFLADRRVVEIPRIAWRPILHGVILRTRPAKSAARYAAIWTKDGSPLAVHTNKQRVLVSGYVGQRLKTLGLPADHAVVEYGMRYGEPSIGSALDRLREAPVRDLESALAYASGAVYERDRTAVTQRMQAMGTVLLDTLPDTLAVSLVNRYIDLKRSGRF